VSPSISLVAALAAPTSLKHSGVGNVSPIVRPSLKRQTIHERICTQQLEPTLTLHHAHHGHISIQAALPNIHATTRLSKAIPSSNERQPSME